MILMIGMCISTTANEDPRGSGLAAPRSQEWQCAELDSVKTSAVASWHADTTCRHLRETRWEPSSGAQTERPEGSRSFVWPRIAMVGRSSGMLRGRGRIELQRDDCD